MNVVVCRSSKRRSISISVNENLEVLVLVPQKTKDEKINEILKEKQGWIEKKIEYFARVKKISTNFETIEDGQTILLFGKEITIRIVNVDKKIVTFDGDVVAVYSTFGDASKVFNKWLNNFAQAYFKQRLEICFERFAQKVACQFPTLKIRKMIRRWGAMSSSNVMVLNLALIFVPPQCIDYVVMHELCHIKHMNHGKSFHELQGFFTPNYKEIKKILENFVIVRK